MELKSCLTFLKISTLKIFFTALFIISVVEAFAQLPVPAFRANQTSGCSPVVVDFTDESTGATSWQWDLGNGVTSTQQNPSTVYSNSGSFTVKLTVTNANGSQTLTKTNFITINEPPDPNFNSNQTSGCFPLRVQFFDLSNPGTGTIVSWNWNFGNGATSTQQNPLYAYTASGTFYVSLTVTNSAGCSKTIVKPAYISVANGVTTAFNVSPSINCKPPEIISFTNLSSGPGTLSYQWDFGDGNTSTLQNPSHNYLTAGPFSIRLITSSSSGCIDTLIKPNAVQLNNVQTVIGSPVTACVNEPINFQNLSTPVPISSSWFFGDATTSNQINPVKTYTTTGSFIIKLVNQYSQCVDSTTANIVINPVPTADFRSIDTISCRAPHTVNFQDQSTGAVSWAWDFGDGGISSLSSPSHTYNTLGSFTVRLIVTNNLGCTDTMTKVAYVRIEKPIFNPIVSPFEGCRLLNVQFFANTTSIDPIVSWRWDFGDGNTSPLTNTSNVFDSGSYNIKLVVTTTQGCIDSIILNNGVRVGTKPTANFNAVPVAVCAYAPIQFNDLSTGNPDQWNWDFGNTVGSTIQNPTYTYQDTGLFTIRLIVYNNRCADTSTRITYIRVLPPIARFTYAINCISNKRQIQFTDRSIVATTWNWDFGDGNFSISQNPNHTYASLGTYTVTLISTNGACSHSQTQIISIVDESSSFSARQTTVCRNEQIQFTSQIANPLNITNYRWNFGNGDTSSAINPIYSYVNSGTYTVQLTITDINGCQNTLTRNSYIRINGPVADFNVGTNQVCINRTIQLRNNSTTDGVNAFRSVLWDLGNGDRVNILANPFNYTYLSGGVFTIRIIVTDASGCTDSLEKLNIVTVLNPDAKFIVDTPSCPGALLNFINQSSGTTGTETYTWTFGDASSSNAISPTHAYAAVGNYTVKLLLLESIGCRDSAFINIRISRPQASFTVNDSISICQPFEAKFTSTSTFANSSAWIFGDGNSSNSTTPNNFYITPGSYTSRLVVTSPGGCSDTAYKPMKLGRDTGTLNYSPLVGCSPLSVNLQTRTDVPLNYTWDFGDGNIFTTSDSNRLNIYNIGFFVPKLIITDRLGCFGVIEGIDTIKVLGSSPNFGADQYLFCDSGIVQFIDSTVASDVITSYLWNFGDGNTSGVTAPSHKYTSPGIYNVTLTIRTQAGCINTKTKNALIKVVASPQINITGAGSFCVPVNLQLQGNWLNPDTSSMQWKWNIDGQIFNTLTPPLINRTIADSVFIQFTAINSSGCKDTANNVAVVNPLPNVFAGNDTTICLGNFATLNPSGAASYIWSPPTYLNCTNCNNPQATVTDPIQYIVTGRSALGCDNTDSVIIKVKKPFKVQVSGSDTLCLGENIRLSASGAENYLWTPSATLNNAGIANPLASPTTSTIYKVVGFDSLNCFRDSALISIIVYDYPVIAMNDTTIRAGDTILFKPQLSADVTKVIWSPNYNLSCTNCFTTLAWPYKTTTYKLTAQNAGDCATRTNFKVTVLCNKDDVFIPNAFTPNNDKTNDWFYIIGKAVKTVVFLRVYNRWGNLVFEKTYFDANNRTLGWDGKINGQDAPVGLYSYSTQVICADGGFIPLNGTVTLIR